MAEPPAAVTLEDPNAHEERLNSQVLVSRNLTKAAEDCAHTLQLFGPCVCKCFVRVRVVPKSNFFEAGRDWGMKRGYP